MVRFDPQTRTITQSDGRAAQLRNKSKDVLSCLLETPNQTVSKIAIIDRVWTDVTVSDESLVQCIADIRKVIGVDAKQIVETVPREGYRVNLPLKTPKPIRFRLAVLVFGLVMVGFLAMLNWPKTETPMVQSVSSPSIDETPPGTANTDAYLEVLKGRVSSNIFSHSESLEAERHYRRAITMDPNYARAYAELGTLLAVRFENDWTVLVNADRDKSLYYAQQAVLLDPDLWLGHFALGRLYSVFGNLDAAETHLEAAMSLQPENEDARAYLGIVKIFRGDPESAIAILEAAIRSHPNPPHWYYFGWGHALFNAGQFAQAESALQDCLLLAENSPYCLRYLIAVLGEMDRLSEAQQAGETYAAMGFDLSVSGILDLMTFHHKDDQARLEAALRRAGLPD
ncbi:MAG: tetratricopeptide repeat protein [Paracoccaceae bacterium]